MHISVATLWDTWPEGEWEEPEIGHESRDEMAVPEPERLEINTPSTSKSLRDRAMDTVLQALLDEHDEKNGRLSEADS